MTQELRPVSIELNVNRYAEGSALIRWGNTHVLCNATLQDEVPGWLKGKGKGWVTAEYSMLPRATHTRTKREREKVSGRTQEIQRLVGRALRSVVDLKALGERSLMIDCDVLQADGGTRTASITGGYVAMAAALSKLAQKGVFAGFPLVDSVAAVSVGLVGGNVVVDLNYEQDSTADVDMNFVVTGKGKLVEVQGTAEGAPFDEAALHALTKAALVATAQLTAIQNSALK